MINNDLNRIANSNEKITLSQLENFLLKSADILRGKMDASEFKAITMCEEITGKKLDHSYTKDNPIGDRIWWISYVSKFKLHYPQWNYKYEFKKHIDRDQPEQYLFKNLMKIKNEVN